MPWRALLLAAVFSVLAGGALAAELSGTDARPAATAGARVVSRGGLLTLPSALRTKASAAVAAASPAYRVTAAGAGLQAVNAAQGLRARFRPSGVVLSDGHAVVGLRLAAIGTGASDVQLGQVAPAAHANRVTYTHAGVAEWYANEPLGLEQGFTVARAPSGGGDTLTLTTSLSGDAHATLDPGGRAITFVEAGSTLRYGDLVATDASGRTLHSQMALAAGQIRLTVDTRGASYPVSIDPLVQQGSKLSEPARGIGLAGFSVALSADGNTALVGVPRANGFAGLALVFTRSGSTWSQPAELIGSDTGEGSETQCAEEPSQEEACGFGSSVALSADGDTALIGGSRDSGYAGAAWVFTRSNAGEWTQQGPKLTATDESGNARFGRSVALSANGDTALIGGPLDGGTGAAWVFTRSEGNWSQQGAKLTSGDPESRFFGRSVALSGDGNTAVVGDPCDAACTGGAWVFSRSGSAWSSPAKLTAGSDETGEGRFGFSVALSADASTALIGARTDNEGAGAAWAFAQQGGIWSHQGGKLTGGATVQAKFGWSVALSAHGEAALVGAPGEGKRMGAAWSFAREGGVWAPGESPAIESEQGIGDAGQSVALSANGETALVGGPGDDGLVGAVWTFVQRPVPIVTSVRPNEGPSSGGTEVTIVGSGFTNVVAVDFGSENGSPSPTVVSPTEIRAISPPGKGTVDVTVTSSAGTSLTKLSDQFTYVNAKGHLTKPVVKSVTPAEGSTEGGTRVTLEGSGFSEASKVKFGETEANFTEDSPTKITVIAPRHVAGTVPVIVRAHGGESEASSKAQFTFVGGSPGSPSSEGSSTSGTGAGTGTATNGAAGGVLGFGPLSVSNCAVALRGKTISVQGYKRASVKLSWAGVGTCSGRLKLTVKQKLAHPRRGRSRYRIRTIGSGAFAIVAGSVQTVKVNLNSLGRALLKARHGRLNASIAITKLSPGPVQARSASVRLMPAKTSEAHKHKR